MNQQPEISPEVASLDEPAADTSDVRAAIARAKESLDAETITEHTQAEVDASDTAAQKATSSLPPEPVLMPSAIENAASGVDPQQVTIPADHPMAPLYIQQPMPPTPKANRLAGLLITLLATLGFAFVYAGVLAGLQAPLHTPAQFLQQGLLPYLTSLGFVLPIAAFFVGMLILVLIFNRAGWWVYAVLGVIVALLVWGAAGAGYALSPQLLDEVSRLAHSQQRFDLSRIGEFALTLPAVAAAFVAREVVVWFGAWIGARGRKIKDRNAEQMREYEEKLREVQARVQ